MWALGILSLQLACRNQGLDPSIAQTFSNHPTPSQPTIDSLLRRLSHGSNAFSKATYDFIGACLRVDPRRRIRAETAMRHPLLTYNEGVFRELEELRNRGSDPDEASPLVEMGRELRDVAPDWKIGMKAIPPPARSDSAAQWFGTAHPGPSMRRDPYKREPFPMAPAALRAKVVPLKDGASPYTPRTPADEPQNPFRMSPRVPQAATMRGPHISPTRGADQGYISPKPTERTLPIHNPRPRRPPVWSLFSKNPPIHNPNPAIPGPPPDVGDKVEIQKEAGADAETKKSGAAPAKKFTALRTEFGRGAPPTDPGPWQRDIRGRGTPYPRFHRD